jgi:hypothetical protein
MSKIIPNDPVGSNPAVHSKFDRSQGKGLRPPHLSHPGETAPLTGTHVAGHNENGHKEPVKHSHGYGAPVQTHHEPHAGRMAEGVRTGHTPKTTQYDRRKGSGKHG